MALPRSRCDAPPSEAFDANVDISKLVDAVDDILLKNSNNKRAKLLRKILDELNEIDHDENEFPDATGVPTNPSQPMASAPRTATYIPHLAPCKPFDKSAWDQEHDSGYSSTRTKLGKIPFSKLTDTMDLYSIDTAEPLDPHGAEDDDIENENEYVSSSAGDYWTTHTLDKIDSALECSRSERSSESLQGSQDSLCSDDEYESQDNDCASAVDELDDIQRKVIVNSRVTDKEKKIDISDSASDTSEDMEFSEDRTRMNQYLAPYSFNTAKSLNNSFKRTSQKPRRRRQRNRRNRAQSGSDVPSQSSGDDDEMSYDDEQYAQAIADWRVVLPLEPSRLGIIKDDAHANHVDDARLGFTRNDFMESLILNTHSVGHTSTAHAYDEFVVADVSILSDEHGARILASASPPTIKSTVDVARRFRSWEQQTATSRNRNRIKVDTASHQRLVAIGRRRQGVNVIQNRKGHGSPMCYDASAGLNSSRQAVLPVLGVASKLREFAGVRGPYLSRNDIKDLSVGTFSKSNKTTHGQQSDSNFVPTVDIEDCMGNLYQIASLADAVSYESDSSEVKPSDLPANFSVSDRWKSYLTNSNFTDGSSSEELEVFHGREHILPVSKIVSPKVFLEIDNKAYSFADHRESDFLPADIRSSLSLDDFIAKYAVDDYVSSDSGKYLASFPDADVCDALESGARESLMFYPTSGKFDTEGFSADHILPENHPSVSIPYSLTHSDAIDEELLKAYKKHASVYSSRRQIDSAASLRSPDFNNIRVNARLDSSIDVSGGSLPLAALDEASVSEAHANLPPEKAFGEPRFNVPSHALHSDFKFTRVDHALAKAASPTYIKSVPAHVATKSVTIGSSAKRSISKQASNPGLPLLLRNVLHPVSATRRSTNSPQSASSYSDIVSALANAAGVRIAK